MRSIDQSTKPVPFAVVVLCCAVLWRVLFVFLASLTTKESRSPQCRRSHIHVSTTTRRAENAQIILTAPITPAPAAGKVAAHFSAAVYAQESRFPFAIHAIVVYDGDICNVRVIWPSRLAVRLGLGINRRRCPGWRRRRRQCVIGPRRRHWRHHFRKEEDARSRTARGWRESEM